MQLNKLPLHLHTGVLSTLWMSYGLAIRLRLRPKAMIAFSGFGCTYERVRDQFTSWSIAKSREQSVIVVYKKAPQKFYGCGKVKNTL